MIYIYGDSHANSGFKNLSLPHMNLYRGGTTMFGVSARNKIMRYNDVERENNSIICICYQNHSKNIIIQNLKI